MPKISDYPARITPLDGALGVVAQIDTANFRVATDLISQWIGVDETWTYASATTINVPTGAASRYQKGDKLRLKQGGSYKYFNIVTVADMLLTVTGGTDYTVANAAITDIYISRSVNPFGFPAAFNWTSSNPTGFSGTPTAGFTFRIDGRKIFYLIDINGTSNAGTFTYTSPITLSGYHLTGWITDNSAFQAHPGLLEPGGGTTVNVYKDGAVSAFTASGGKRIIAKFTDFLA